MVLWLFIWLRNILQEVVDIKIKKLLRPFVFTVCGGICGFLYYYYVGCRNGTCAITSTPINSIVYVGLIGLLVSQLFERGCDKECST